MLSSFKLINSQAVPELNLTANLYVHNQTGAEVLDIISPIENKSFGICFKTPAIDDTGVTHILEHSVLAGSKKYPTKGPFIEIIKTSLASYINAFTYPDKTVYPVASPNEQDLLNMMEVYLDATFFPIINEDRFRQEGWHWELLEENQNPVLKGVVYNEMKGVCSSEESFFEDVMLNKMHPDNCYRNFSGGLPTAIPELDYDSFVNYHKKHYHPSNSRTVLFGNASESTKMKQFELLEEYFGGFEKLDVSAETEIKNQKKLSRRVETVAFPSDSDRGSVGIGWILDETANTKKRMLYQVLFDLILGSEIAPLKKALLESGLGEDLIQTGLETVLKQLNLTVGLKNVAIADMDKFEPLILETLESIAQNGFENEVIQSTLSKFEFELKSSIHQKNLGIELTTSILRSWLHGSDPMIELGFLDDFEYAKEMISKNPNCLQELIKNEILSTNSHLVLKLIPDNKLAHKQEQDEQQKAIEYKKSLNSEQIQELIRQNKELIRKQETPDSQEDIDKIPVLKIQDIDPIAPKEGADIYLAVNASQTDTSQTLIKQANQDKISKDQMLGILQQSGILVLNSNFATSGITAVSLVFDISSIDKKLIPLLYLFDSLQTRLRTQNLDLKDISIKEGLYTGGIDNSTLFLPISSPQSSSENSLNNQNPNQKPEKNLVKIYAQTDFKCLDENLKKATDLALEIVTGTLFDDKNKILQIIKEIKSEMEAMVPESGQDYSLSQIASKLTFDALYADYYSGLEQLKFIQELDQRLSKESSKKPSKESSNAESNEELSENTWEVLKNSLKEIQQKIASSLKLVSIATPVDKFQQNQSIIFEIINKLNKYSNVSTGSTSAPTSSSLLDIYKNQIQLGIQSIQQDSSSKPLLILDNMQIAYTGSGLNVYDLGYQFEGSFYVIQNIIKRDYLWNRVRVIGGAYGAIMKFDRLSGNLTFCSYRDPNITKTLENYKQIGQYLETLEMDSQTLEKSIIGSFGTWAGYQTIFQKAQKNTIRMLISQSYQEIQATRNQLLNTKLGSIRNFGKFLKDFDAKVCVVCSPQKVDQESINLSHYEVFKAKNG